jgi:hypothetical protein
MVTWVLFHSASTHRQMYLSGPDGKELAFRTIAYVPVLHPLVLVDDLSSQPSIPVFLVYVAPAV